MEPMMPPQKEKFTQTLTFKGLMIGIMILFLLIPKVMIVSLIEERQERSLETIDRINSKWSYAQTFCGPVLSIPYTVTEIEVVDKKEKINKYNHVLNLTPENLHINTKLFPEERHYGIYKTMLYTSEMDISGMFSGINIQKEENTEIHWNQAYITLGVTDLRGITNNILFILNGKEYTAEAGLSDRIFGKKLILNIDNTTDMETGKPLEFACKLNLNGSSDINFIPIGKTTKVNITGAWTSPGFIGNFSPEYNITEEGPDKGFDAKWSVLHFNRNIPDKWIDNQVELFDDSSFGVNLVQTVDHYQQNMRSAKYAIMFIALTFCVFFFVEILTKKKIHPVQYLLVGIALILFYSLLLSISEQINFAIAYIIASIATIGLISGYAQSIFKNKTQTGILAAILSILYIFLYVVLQLEDMSLLIGSIGLFIILGIIMYLSRKINWYKQDSK